VKCKDGTFYTESLDLAFRYAQCNKGTVLRIMEERVRIPVPRKEKAVKPMLPASILADVPVDKLGAVGALLVKGKGKTMKKQ
jgi:hypothetical protein